MSDAKTKESHEERTAHEPRDMTLHDVILAKVTPVGSLVRLLRLQIPTGQPDIKFLPGQWVDCFVPGIPKAGGFTITSTPSKAVTTSKNTESDRYIELAVKVSPENPAAAWLWQDIPLILGQTLRLRIGGSFVFPPAELADISAARIVFVAGGVGINPLISMVSHIGELDEGSGPKVTFLYSVREDAPAESDNDEDDDPVGRILFMQRLASLYSRESVRGQLKVFLTGGDSSTSTSTVLSCNEEDVPCERRRITTADVDAAVLEGDASNVYVYVCGVPTMTDDFVAHLTGSKDSGGLGLASHQVLYEKWW